MIYASEDPGPANWEDVQKVVGLWKADLVRGLGPQAPADLDWDESRSAPYFTDRPGWDAYTALVLLAACTACGEPMPERLPEDALVADVVLRTHHSEMRRAHRSITLAQLWLPGSFEFSFDFVDLCREKIHISSIAGLVLDLDHLMAKNGISETDLAAALQGGPGENPTAFKIARFGLAVFRHVALDARKNQLPLMLSF
jgi:hypothetical protein